MERFIMIIGLLMLTNLAICQEESDGQSAFRYKLDYNVPESPAFSVLGSNPTTVMRGSASQKVVVNLASAFLSGGNADSGIGIDFNPYFVFGGRLRSISEYRKNPLKRILANTQLSFGTVNDMDRPDDLLMATGVRVTLFDTKDPMFDVALGKQIDSILAKANESKVNNNQDENEDDFLSEDFSNDESTIVGVDFSPAYTASKRRYKTTAGGSMSLGAALATRAMSKSLVVDSLVNEKSQIWLSGQYDFGVSGLSMTGMLMYEYIDNLEANQDGTIAGLAIRQYRDQAILNAELSYNSRMDGFEAAALYEYYGIQNIVLFASYSYRVDDITGLYNGVFMPGIKWNISEEK